ncbi:hypothetical protein SKAU_G00193160 [Synaphobranchus kaupii]|uniref:Uncharacterized protein n=1 Tax=Synaphobranchus kaupii TaxID=118154 RepID=A0A9Q1FE62_SYNKA|nr:hypothetical protein SKAU_G00193160 [Synaphobranchus kaupii]
MLACCVAICVVTEELEDIFAKKQPKEIQGAVVLLKTRALARLAFFLELLAVKESRAFLTSSSESYGDDQQQQE